MKFSKTFAAPWAMAWTSAVVCALLAWTPLATRFDNAVYDWLERVHPAGVRSPAAVVAAIDDRTLMETGGDRALRRTLTRLLNLLAAAPPAALAIDVTLADDGVPREDAELSAAMARIPNLVLASEMLPDGAGWQEPIPAFAAHAAAIGHVHALAGPFDEINRRIPLEKVSARKRHWALSLDTLRLYLHAPQIISSPTDVTVGCYTFHSRWDEGRPFRIRYRLPGEMETVSVRDLLSGAADPASLGGRVVFVGVTSLSAIRDRLFTPVALDRPMAGVEIHAQAFETLAAGASPGGTLLDVSPAWTILLAFAFASLTAAAFAFLHGKVSLAAGIAVLAMAQFTPYLFFRQGLVLPAFAPVSASGISFIACGAWRFLIVRKQLASAESAKSRYQQAFHFVAHEMRTPLTAIQGSSELISRYNLPEEKRKQIGQMINSESKRLARMITTFLDVERLNAGQMEMNTTAVDVGALIETCIVRAAGLADSKAILIGWPGAPDLTLQADRELLEYAVYNLLTNAIKYSPRESRVRIMAGRSDRGILISVADQGIGMTKDEVKKLFQKFYRTERAEKSGIQGTGIGLSIVKEIVTLHGGSITVESAPEQGSTFTVSLPA